MQNIKSWTKDTESGTMTVDSHLGPNRHCLVVLGVRVRSSMRLAQVLTHTHTHRENQERPFWQHDRQAVPPHLPAIKHGNHPPLLHISQWTVILFLNEIGLLMQIVAQQLQIKNKQTHTHILEKMLLILGCNNPFSYRTTAAGYTLSACGLKWKSRAWLPDWMGL